MQFVILQEICNHNVRLWSPDAQVLAVIARDVLMDAARVPGDGNFDNQKLILLAEANIDALSRIAARKHEVGDIMPTGPGDVPCVMILAKDIAPETLSASIVSVPPFSWGTTLTS